MKPRNIIADLYSYYRSLSTLATPIYRSKCNSRPLHEREKACFTRCERRRGFKTDQSMISRESLTHINEWYWERWAFAGRVTPPCYIYACQSRSFQEIADSFADRSENRSVPVRFTSFIQVKISRIPFTIAVQLSFRFSLDSVYWLATVPTESLVSFIFQLSSWWERL